MWNLIVNVVININLKIILVNGRARDVLFSVILPSIGFFQLISFLSPVIMPLIWTSILWLCVQGKYFNMSTMYIH